MAALKGATVMAALKGATALPPKPEVLCIQRKLRQQERQTVLHRHSSSVASLMAEQVLPSLVILLLVGGT